MNHMTYTELGTRYFESNDIDTDISQKSSDDIDISQTSNNATNNGKFFKNSDNNDTRHRFLTFLNERVFIQQNYALDNPLSRTGAGNLFRIVDRFVKKFFCGPAFGNHKCFRGQLDLFRTENLKFVLLGLKYLAF